MVEQSQFDVIASDWQLPDVSGLELLDELMRRRPEQRRIILAEESDSGSVVQSVGKAHRQLIKPCDLSTFSKALDQVITLQHWVPGDAVQKLMARMERMPSPPTTYFEVIAEMQSPDTSIDRIGEVISRDPAITAKLLQLANSAVFGLRLQVVNPTEAVGYVGVETTKSLLLLAHTFASFEDMQTSGFRVDTLWRHSIMTGQFARTIAMVENSPSEIVEQAFTAGLLHDVGKLLFAANMPELFTYALTRSREQKRSMWEMETQVLGACHGQAGACMLGIWGLPSPVVEAIALHHFPGCRSEFSFSPLTAVHAANVIEHEALPENALATPCNIDDGYLITLGLEARADEWRRQCLARTSRAAA